MILRHARKNKVLHSSDGYNTKALKTAARLAPPTMCLRSSFAWIEFESCCCCIVFVVVLPSDYATLCISSHKRNTFSANKFIVQRTSSQFICVVGCFEYLRMCMVHTLSLNILLPAISCIINMNVQSWFQWTLFYFTEFSSHRRNWCTLQAFTIFSISNKKHWILCNFSSFGPLAFYFAIHIFATNKKPP